MDVMNINGLLYYDKFDPIKRLEMLYNEMTCDELHDYFFLDVPDIEFYPPGKCIDLNEVILLALNLFNLNFNSMFEQTFFYYIQDDNSVKYIIEQSINSVIPDDEFLKSLIFVDNVKFIYRFTTAKKFNIQNPFIKQLRLNSWGKDFIEKKQLNDKYHKLRSSIDRTIKEYFNKYNKQYRRLSKHLLMNIDMENSELIKKINSELKIKVLS